MKRRAFSLAVAASLAAGSAVVVFSVTLTGQSGSTASARPDAASLPGTENVKAFIASLVQKNWTPPKTPWGHPDLQGIFTTKDEANTPLERPAEWDGRRMEEITPQELAEAVAKRQEAAIEAAPFAGGGEPGSGVAIAVPIHWFDNLNSANSRPWWVIDPVDGKIPALTAEAQKRPRTSAFGTRVNSDPTTALRGGHRDTYLDRYLGDRCIMWAAGVPHTPTLYGNSLQILQSKDYLIFRFEMIHEARMIPLDGRSLPGPALRGYLGYSRGYWEGNTLVIETTNLHEGANYRGGPGKNLRLIERLTRIAPNKVEWSMTFDDPTTWEHPWTFSMPMTEDDSQLIHEYACHEGNFGMANLLSAARAEEKKAAPQTKR